MKYFKKIEGERIYLSPASIEDAEIYTKWMNDRKVTDGLHSTHKVNNLEGEKDWLNDSLKNKDYSFAIVLKDGDKLIGNCSLMSPNFRDRNAEVGIFIGEEEYRNSGFGTEAIKLLLDYGFNILNLHNIYLWVFAFNEGAVKCYKKSGFKECGRRHEISYLDGKYQDDILMEILEDDYRNMPK